MVIEQCSGLGESDPLAPRKSLEVEKLVSRLPSQQPHNLLSDRLMAQARWMKRLRHVKEVFDRSGQQMLRAVVSPQILGLLVV